MREITVLLQAATGPVFVDNFADDFAASKDLCVLIGRMGLMNHPALCERLATHPKLRTADVTAVMYHCDLESTFVKHTKISKEMTKRRKDHIAI